MYCTTCGIKLTPVSVGGYDGKTGERNTALVCPRAICGHTGVYHNYVKRKWYQRGYFICIECGHIDYYIDYL